MLVAGHARAYGLPGSYACNARAHGPRARRPRRGCGSLGQRGIRVRSARATRNLLRRRNSYEIVAGTVAKVAVTKARTYVNSAATGGATFTAGVEPRVLRANPELEQMLQVWKAGASWCAAGFSIATGLTSTSRTRARSLSPREAPRSHAGAAGCRNSSGEAPEAAPKGKAPGTVGTERSRSLMRGPLRPRVSPRPPPSASRRGGGRVRSWRELR
jgi:hypothetical protein